MNFFHVTSMSWPRFCFFLQAQAGGVAFSSERSFTETEELLVTIPVAITVYAISRALAYTRHACILLLSLELFHRTSILFSEKTMGTHFGYSLTTNFHGSWAKGFHIGCGHESATLNMTLSDMGLGSFTLGSKRN